MLNDLQQEIDNLYLRLKPKLAELGVTAPSDKPDALGSIKLISTVVNHLLKFKFDNKESQLKDASRQYLNLESALQRLEEENRKHIRIEQQVRLMAEVQQEQIEKAQVQNNELKNTIQDQRLQKELKQRSTASKKQIMPQRTQLEKLIQEQKSGAQLNRTMGQQSEIMRDQKRQRKVATSQSLKRHMPTEPTEPPITQNMGKILQMVKTYSRQQRNSSLNKTVFDPYIKTIPKKSHRKTNSMNSFHEFSNNLSFDQ